MPEYRNYRPSPGWRVYQKGESFQVGKAQTPRETCCPPRTSRRFQARCRAKSPIAEPTTNATGTTEKKTLAAPAQTSETKMAATGGTRSTKNIVSNLMSKT